MGVTPVACTRFCERPDLVHVGGTKNPDIDAIVALAPDVVLMDREENRREDAEALMAAGLDVFATHVRSVSDVAPMLADLAARLDVGPLRTEPASRGQATPTVTAFVAIWRRPWMTISAATYGSSVLTAIGVSNIFAGHADAYPTVALDEVAALAPDAVLLPTEPYSFEPAHVAELRLALGDLAIIPVDGQDLFWWGARTSAAIERLRASCHQIDGPRSP